MLTLLQMLSLPFLALSFIGLVTALGFLTFRDHAREAAEQNKADSTTMRNRPHRR